MKNKVLIVEDNVELSDLYKARLELDGYEIRVEADGDRALAAAIEFAPDLVLLDVMMPKISGFDVLDILKSTEKTKDLKIVLLTALSQLQDKTRGAKLGADDYLVKSEASIEDVARCVRETLAGAGGVTAG